MQFGRRHENLKKVRKNEEKHENHKTCKPHDTNYRMTLEIKPTMKSGYILSIEFK